MSDAFLSSGLPVSPVTFPEQMTALRLGRGLSLRRLAQSAGVSHDALGAWERGERLPRLPELEATLMALGVGSAERLRLITLVPAPRAQHHVRTAERGGWAEAAGPMPGAGNLLRAMRGRRGLTQADAARAAGVSQGRLARWEQSEDWPTVERLHRLCFVLGVAPQEAAALTCGRGALPGWDEAEEAEAWAYRGPASPDDPLGGLIKCVYFRADALRDLRSLSLERALWLRARDDEAARSHLHDAYAYRARAMMEEGRFSEIGPYADRTWELARQGYGRSQFWTWSVIASATALRRSSAVRCTRAAALLASMAPQVLPGENQAWILSDLAVAMAESGRADEALRASAQAQDLAERLSVPEELLFRRRDHAVLLAALGRHGEALDVLETASGLSRFGPDPIIRRHLLAADCHLGLGNAGAAQECLTPALALIERSVEPGNVHLARLRPQADALLARL